MKNTIQDYTIIEKIDETSGSETYRAKHTHGNQTVVIKVLNVKHPSSSEITRFKQEYALIGKINLPGVIQVYDLLEHEGKFTLILEDFNGMPMHRFFHDAPMPVNVFLEISVSLSQTLGHLHKQNIVHLDIKPRNIRYNPETRQVKITDFGIIAQMTRENEEIYRPDIIRETLAYVSPEQTGRVNRQVDYRTDLYSLGVIFYEMLTGKPPFISHDPMELIHAHIARKPVPPSRLNPEIPEVVSDIILTLMSKNAENRYQNSFGLMADLTHCMDLNEKGEIRPFKLRTRDISLRFSIPQKLYGRGHETVRLISAFDDASQGRTGIMFVSGSPGVGKTSLINEVQKPIIEKKGFFISGKYDQSRRDVPYSAIIQAFQGLVRQLLLENKDMIDIWRERLTKTLSPNEAIIAQMIPDIAHIIGPRPEIAELGSEEFKNRFIRAFNNFIKVFAKKAHPLTLFLDDAQWADLSSFHLLKSIIKDSEITHLFIIISYRNNEITPGHPFLLLMDELKKEGFPFQEIRLTPLETRDVTPFITDILGAPESLSQPLADIVHKKTGGNPFFMNQFMKTLYDRELLQANPDTGWQWDLIQIQHLQITDNVVDLLSEKIAKLPENTREILKNGACIGNIFDLEILSFILDTPMEKLWHDVKTAINDGYIDLSEDHLKFQHDRIREAAYQLMPEEKQKQIHYRIGWHIFEKTKTTDLSHHIFFIADHLNRAKSLITDPNKKNELVKLNLMAGEKAIHSAAYASALTYLENGISLLREDAWTAQYALCHKLHEGAVAASCLDGRFELMDKYRNIALRNTENLLDQVTFYNFKILSHIAHNNLIEAVKTGLLILEQLGVRFPKSPGKRHVLLGLIRVKKMLRKRKVEELINLPEMTDPVALSAMRIIDQISTPAFQTNAELYALLGFKRLLLSVQKGNTSGSAIAYAAYGVLCCGILEDFDTGNKFGDLALNLLEKFKNTKFKAHTIMTIHGFIKHWKNPVKESLPALYEGFKIGKETGAHSYAAYCSFIYCGYGLLAGTALAGLNEELNRHLQAVKQLNQENAYTYMSIIKQVILNLKGESQDPSRLIGAAYNEYEMIPVHRKANDISALAFLFAHKQYLSYTFDKLENALKVTAIIKKYQTGTRATLNIPRVHLFTSLVYLKQYPHAIASEKRKILKHVIRSEKKLKKYALHSPHNSEFAYCLVKAEHAGVIGDYKHAITYFDRALRATRESGFIHYEALANELTAKFYLSNGHMDMARFYFHNARLKYRQWGAFAKIDHLSLQYSDIFLDTIDAMSTPVNDDETSAPSPLPTLGTSKNMDIYAITKASEAIFGEIVLSRLLKRLMAILIENAGAEKGFIILRDNDQLLVEAESRVESQEVDVLKSIPVDQHKGLSAAVISYAARTKNTIILNDALTEGQFTRDPYIIKNRSRSILCMPVLNQGRLSAILYLENNLATNVFTEERLRILNILSSQIAVSIDNARLYDNLEQKIKARTAQLEHAQNENLKKAHRAGMADIARETLHNMGNILSSIKTSAEALGINGKHTALYGLASANQLLRSHMDQLEDFILHDPKGKKLIEYYLVLESIFNREKEDTNYQVNRLKEKIDEIIKVINTLQSHISSDDTYVENVRLKDEVKFVLETKQDGLIKHNIKLVEKYADVPMIRAQKSKLAHIMDNLIINAREALENAPAQEKIITIETEKDDNNVLLHICDNGDGISPENIQKIFFHGYTTKPGRAGHSLHNCANSMTEMGGKIYAKSKGKGSGAIFTLAFPL